VDRKYNSLKSNRC